MKNELVIGGRTFRSRLFVGTGKFSSNELMASAIEASQTEMVTVAMKRIDMNNPEDDMLAHVRRPGIQLLPNTSGVRDAEEAVLAAQLAREAFGTNFIKLEIHPDPKYLLPDPVETLRATEQLVKLGFVVLPYIQADPVLCKRLEEAGAATVMPLAAPIGTNKGLRRTRRPPWSWEPTPCWSIRPSPLRATPSAWHAPSHAPSRRAAKPTRQVWVSSRAMPTPAAPSPRSSTDTKRQTNQ